MAGRNTWLRGLAVLWLALALASALVRGYRAGWWARSDLAGGPVLSAPLGVTTWGDLHGAQPPVVLLHGLPGSRDNFLALGQILAAHGQAALAFDLPGFGASRSIAGSRSMLAHAQRVLEELRRLRVERFHALGWSQGGGVALHLADLAPERVHSVALVASIGLQAGEGSGSYYFEHAKYATGLGIVRALDFLLPHFGALDGLDGLAQTLLAFWDSDQRPLSALLDRLQAPLLVLHGRHDFLVPLWVAQDCHARVASSRLVVFDAGHFLPLGGNYGQVSDVVGELVPFFSRHATPGVGQQRSARNEPWVKRKSLPLPFALQRKLAWWMWFLGLVYGFRRWPGTSAVLGGLAAGLAQLDLGIVGLACLAGLAWAAFVRRSKWRQRLAWFGARAALFAAAFALSVALSTWLSRAGS